MEPTMTLVELAAEFRAHGISTSLVTLGDGIEQGVYPFAVLNLSPLTFSTSTMIVPRLLFGGMSPKRL